MSKKKTAVRLSPVKVILPIFALVILFVVVLAIINCSTKAKTYECTKFEQVVSTTSGEITDNLLDLTYSYYKLTMKRNKTFGLEYKLKKNDKVETYEGTYKVEGDTYYLSYKANREEPSTCIYKLKDNVLSRDQFVSINDKNGRSEFRGTIKQEFKLVTD